MSIVVEFVELKKAQDEKGSEGYMDRRRAQARQGEARTQRGRREILEEQ